MISSQKKKNQNPSVTNTLRREEKIKSKRSNPYVVGTIDMLVTRRKYGRLQEHRFSKPAGQVFEGPAQGSESIDVFSIKGLRTDSKALLRDTSKSSKLSDWYPSDRPASRIAIISLQARIE